MLLLLLLLAAQAGAAAAGGPCGCWMLLQLLRQRTSSFGSVASE
jgi:hypothetical protein